MALCNCSKGRTGSTCFKMRPSSAALQDRPQEYEQARGKYIIDKNTMQILSKSAVIMHPLPRVDEVSLQPVIVCV